MMHSNTIAPSNLCGIAGITSAALSIVTWIILIAWTIYYSASYPEATWGNNTEKLNSLQQFIHLIVSLVAGGLFGLVGLIVGGMFSFLALGLSGIGLIRPPRGYAVCGMLLGIVSFVPALLYIVLVTLSILELSKQ